MDNKIHKSFIDFDNALERSLSIKWKTLEQLDNFLSTFESNIAQKSNTKIVWTDTAKETCEQLKKIISSAKPECIINWANSASIELDINNKNIDFKGPYLKQDFFHLNEKNKYAPNQQIKKPEDYALPQKLDKYLSKSNTLSIVGASYCSADGNLIFNTNNASTSQILGKSKNLIILLPLNAIIPSLEDVELFNSLISSTVLGKVSNTHQIIVHQFGIEQSVYIVLFNNDRTDVLADKSFRSILYDYTYGQDINENTAAAVNPNFVFDTKHFLDQKSVYYNTMIKSQKLKSLRFIPFIFQSSRSKELMAENWSNYIEKSIYLDLAQNSSNRTKWSAYFYKKLMNKRKTLDFVSANAKKSAIKILHNNPSINGVSKFKIQKKSFAKQWQNQFK